MNAKQESDEGVEGEPVAVLVEAGAFAELQGDERARLTVIEGATMEEGEAPVMGSMRWEHKSEEERFIGGASMDVELPSPPPPPLMRLYQPSLDQSHELPQQHEQLPVLPPEPVAESKRDVNDSDEPPTTRRSDEWTSTRRSGKRSQQAPRTPTGRASVGFTHVKEAKDEVRADNRQHARRQALEEDKPLLCFRADESEHNSAPGLAIQPEFKSEATADVATESGSIEEKASVVMESSPLPLLGPAADAALQIEEGVDELTESLELAGAAEDSAAPRIGLNTAETNGSAMQPGMVHIYHHDEPTPYPLPVHVDLPIEEPAVAANSPVASITPTVIVPSVATERSMDPELIAGTNAMRPTYSEEQAWVPCVSDSGHTYYYNRFTQECRWQPPQTPGLIQEAFDAFASADGTKRLELLLIDGLDPNAADKDGVTLLHMAVQTGNESTVELLVSYGAAVDSTTAHTTITPLLAACQHGHSHVTKTLLECGASHERTDSDGNCALHMAAYSRSNELLHIVLDAAGDELVNQQNAEGETALHIATKLDNAAAVQALLAHGANPQIEDVQGQTPLIIGILENSVECVQLLQSVESSTGVVSRDQGGSAPLAQATDPYADATDDENDVDKLLASIVPTPESCDHEVLEALRSFVDETQRAISTLEDQLQEKKRNEKNYHAQIQSLSSSLQAANDELQTEKQLRVIVEADAVVKASEYETLRTSFVATMTRCAMLESIARYAHAKLKRERSERARSEDAINGRLQQSLDENASLLQSLYALQATASPNESETRLFVDRSRENPRTSGSSRKVGASARYVQYLGASSEQGQPSYPTNDHNYSGQPAHHAPQLPRQVTFAGPSESECHDKREEVRTGSVPANYTGGIGSEAQYTGRTPPSRVGAVWNRFYENLGQVGAASRGFDTASSGDQASPRTTASVFDAVRISDLQRLQALLLSGSSPNQREPTEKGTPLHLACELGDLDAVVLLCDFAADLEARDEEDNTPLLASCAQGNFECTKFLLQSAASLNAVNVSGETALHLAAWDGSAECVAILIEYGVDTSLTNAFGLTALGNLKTRSPLRHKLDDMAPDHPIRRSIRILEEHEAEQLKQEDKRLEKQSRGREANVAPLPTPSASQPPPARSTWKEWLFGAVKAPAEDAATRSDRDLSVNADQHNEDEQEGSGDDENNLLSYSDAELDASSFQSVAYPPLTPPPEVAEALNRARKR